MFRKFTLLILIASFFFSCEEREVKLNTVDMLTGGGTKAWSLVSLVIVGGEDLVLGDYGVGYEGCFKDDLIVFSKGDMADSTNSGPTYSWIRNKKCGEGDEPDLITGFTLAEDGKSIHIDGLGDYDLIDLTWNRIELSRSSGEKIVGEYPVKYQSAINTDTP